MVGILDRRSVRLNHNNSDEKKPLTRTITTARVVRDSMIDTNSNANMSDSSNTGDKANTNDTAYENVASVIDEGISEGINEKVNRDDLLLVQIDEFREKAQKLQEMLNTKESKAKELADIVEEREIKAQELQQILDERQQEADGLTASVARQIDVLIDRVNEKMQEIEASMNASMNENLDRFGRGLSADVDSLGQAMSGQIGNLGQTITGQISNVGQNMDFGDTLEQTRRITEDGTAAVTSAVNEANANMLKSLGELNDQLMALKQELSEKIHTENVKCFRNIQDLFKAVGDKVDSVNDLEKELKSTKSFAAVTCVLALINTFGFVAIALYIFGVFGTIF